MNIKSDAVRRTVAIAALRFVPASVIARIVVGQPQAARAMSILASLRETELVRRLANISLGDIQRIIEVVEEEPEVAEWRDVLVWARENPRKAQQIVREIMAQAGVPQ